MPACVMRNAAAWRSMAAGRCRASARRVGLWLANLHGHDQRVAHPLFPDAQPDSLQRRPFPFFNPVIELHARADHRRSHAIQLFVRRTGNDPAPRRLVVGKTLQLRQQSRHPRRSRSKRPFQSAPERPVVERVEGPHKSLRLLDVHMANRNAREPL